jgi:hypothetical protein
MKKLVLALLALPLAGCVTPQQERAVENNCRAEAAGRSGFGLGGGANNSFGAYRLYANDYYVCLHEMRYAAAYYGYGDPYGYDYPSAYPNSYPYQGYYAPGVGVGVGAR